MKVLAILSLATLVTSPALALAQDGQAEGAKDAHKIVRSDEVTFEPIEVPGFDSGMEIAVLYGDPGAEDGNYTIRLRFPDGYRFPAHYHPVAENLTVLSGTFLLAMGDDENWDVLKTYAPGAYLYIPPENPHYGGATGETVIQLHGRAPFQILLVNPVS